MRERPEAVLGEVCNLQKERDPELGEGLISASREPAGREQAEGLPWAGQGRFSQWEKHSSR